MPYRSQPCVELYWISAWRDGRAAERPASSHAGRGNIREGSTLSSVPDERDTPAGCTQHIKIQSHYPRNYVDRIATVTRKKKKGAILAATRKKV